jgi:hypothetical protein
MATIIIIIITEPTRGYVFLCASENPINQLCHLFILGVTNNLSIRFVIMVHSTKNKERKKPTTKILKP